MNGAAVIGKGVCGLVAAVDQGGEYVLMGDDSREFEIRVGHGTRAVGGGDELAAHLRGEGGAPKGGWVWRPWLRSGVAAWLRSRG
jgi:hypothetical protein